jgi:hypothetical protein
VLALGGLVGVSLEECCWGEPLVGNVAGELSKEGSLSASLAEVRTLCALSVPVVMVWQLTVVPKEAKNEVPAGVAAKVVV